MTHVLGISIGTRNVGMAVIKQRKLRDHRIRTFRGKWTTAKCEQITDTIEAIIKRDKITDIALKVPKPSHCSENLEELIDGIRELSDWFGIQIYVFTLPTIKAAYSADGKGTKQVIFAALVERYPQLSGKTGSSERSRAYCSKVFEAIVSAELALTAGR
jgi:RNase H-fold protein (predicted Holliday junction resolvase)